MILFDRDGVLLEFEFRKMFGIFATIFPASYNLPQIHADILVLGESSGFPISDKQELAFWQRYCDFVSARFPVSTEQEDSLRKFDYIHYMFRFEDTLPALESLKSKGQQIAILSNNPMTAIHRALNHFGIGKYIDNSYAANEIGIAKPDPRVYKHVLNELSVAPENCLYVDDEPPCVRGALEAGITRSYWLNRKGTANEFGLREIHSLSELEQVLAL